MINHIFIDNRGDYALKKILIIFSLAIIKGLNISNHNVNSVAYALVILLENFYCSKIVE